MNGETSLDIVDETEELASLLNGDNICKIESNVSRNSSEISQLERTLTHESSWEVDVGADLSVDFDETLHDDLCDFRVGQSVLEAITQEDDEWQGLAQLVWTL